MTIHHHLSDTTLMSYAAGTCSEATSLAIATHLSQCSGCRARLRRMEMIGGNLLESAPERPMSDRALSDVFSMIDGLPDDRQIKVTKPVKPRGELPGPLADMLPNGLDDVAWKTIAPGIKSYNLISETGNKSSAKLIRIAPGMTIPEHGHSDNELTLVLRGSYSDEIGRFQAGDIADLDADTNHQPIADTAEDCICLIAMDGPLVFKDLVPRLMQYISGI